MLRKLISLTTAGAIAMAAIVAVPAPAGAQGYYRGGGQGGYGRGGGHYRGDEYGGRGYARRGDYGRGYDGRSYGGRRHYGRCRDRGTGGTILGAIAGGLIGNSVAGYGDRGAGTIVGAGVGALAGRAIDRDC